MKTFFSFLITLLTFIYANAQQHEEFYVETVGDTVKAWNTHAHEECAFIADFDVTISNDTVTIIERDTFAPAADCICYYDFCVNIIQELPVGDVYFSFYRAQYGGEPYFVGATVFSNPLAQTLSLPLSYFQSECYELADVNDTEPNDEDIVLFNYPNPFTGNTLITYSVPYTADVKIVIYDLFGRKISTLINSRMPKGSYQVSYTDLTLNTTTYLCEIEVDGKVVKVLKLAVIK